jgi:SsrA-binding protein
VPLLKNSEKKKMAKTIEIVNRRAEHEYHFLSRHEAGILLVGSEVKSIRAGHAGLTDAYCYFDNGELYVRNMYIKEYDNASFEKHDTRRVRKLLLKKPELRKLERRVKEKGLTLIPYRIYFSERQLVKVEVVLGQGKKSFDKRETIKAKDTKRDLERMSKVRL